MSGAAHIVIPGPNIVVEGGDAKQHQRMEALRLNAAQAVTLKNSEAWPWFVAQCEAKAAYYERKLVHGEGDPRDEDRHRGRIEAYRAMPAVIEGAQAAYERAVKNQKPQSGKEQRT